MNSALIVSYSGKSTDYLEQILKEASVSNITTLSDAGQARRALVEHEFDLCIINAPLPDESGERLAQNIAEQGAGEVILIVKAEMLDEIASHVEDDGVITIAKPLSRQFFWSALKLAQAAHKKMMRMRKENKKLIQKIEDIRIVDRAKCILISHLSMSEPEAHRYLEKQAMDMRLTRRQVAEEIVKTYEN